MAQKRQAKVKAKARAPRGSLPAVHAPTDSIITPSGRPSTCTPHVREGLLKAVARLGSLEGACAEQRVAIRTARSWRHGQGANKEGLVDGFDEDVEIAMDLFRATIIDAEILRRGVIGWEEPILQGGKIVLTDEVKRDPRTNEPVVNSAGEPVYVPLTIRRYSDRMLELLAKGKARQTYSERVEVTGKDGGPVEQKVAFDWGAELSASLARAEAARAELAERRRKAEASDTIEETD